MPPGNARMRPAEKELAVTEGLRVEATGLTTTTTLRPESEAVAAAAAAAAAAIVRPLTNGLTIDTIGVRLGSAVRAENTADTGRLPIEDTGLALGVETTGIAETATTSTTVNATTAAVAGLTIGLTIGLTALTGTTVPAPATVGLTRLRTATGRLPPGTVSGTLQDVVAIDMSRERVREFTGKQGAPIEKARATQRRAFDQRLTPYLSHSTIGHGMGAPRVAHPGG
jgi:hypothetical protein